MTFEEFKTSLTLPTPPIALSPLLKALWYAGKGNWDTSHDIVQDIENSDASWIHAYLHREEGDDWNANYWYRRAGRNMPNQTLQEEWEYIVKELVS